MNIMELAVRRGFIWPSYEIYGGVGGFYDYGPLGATLKKKLEDVWREIYCVREGLMEISSPTVSPEAVFAASGHLKSFVDPIVECEKCGSVFRADHAIQESADVKTEGLSPGELEQTIKEKKVRCPGCGGKLGGVSTFNLMFRTQIGPGKSKVGYLRPETAQGMFMLFSRLYSFYRKRLPFGVVQLGRAYRNEISPRQGVIRLREFNMAEAEIFVDPDEKTCENFAPVEKTELNLVPRNGQGVQIAAGDAVKKGIIAHELLAYHLVVAKEFLERVGLSEKRVRFRQHAKTEMAHYAADCWDAEFETERFGWIEIVGIADRTCYDLDAHTKESGVELKAFKRFNETRTVKGRVLAPNEAALGPAFKEKTVKIVEALKGLDEQAVESFAKSGYIELEIGEESLKLGGDYVELREIKEEVSGENITPHVIEPSYGIDRIIYCILENAYSVRDDKVVLNLKRSVAPVEVAVFPLVSKPELTGLAKGIYESVKAAGLRSTYDRVDSIGRRYARVDEIGVPYAVTVDFDSLSGGDVTVRDRGTTKQVRVKVEGLAETLTNLLSEKVAFEEI